MTNEEFWQHDKHTYPAHAVQPLDAATRPEAISLTHGNFLRVPLADGVYWGFPTTAARTAFLAAHGGTAID